MGKILERKTWHQRLFQYPDFIGDIRMPYLLNDTNQLGKIPELRKANPYKKDLPLLKNDITNITGR